MKDKVEFLENQDVMVRTFSFCSLNDLTVLSQVSKRFNFFSSADSLWKYHLKHDFNLEVPNSNVPKNYYPFIKNQLREEQEMVLEYYTHAFLFCYQLYISALRDSKKFPDLFNKYLKEEKRFALFTDKQILYLASDSVFSFLSNEFEKEDIKYTNAVNLPAIRQSVNNMYRTIDKAILERIKSFAKPHFDAFFETPFVSGNTELPIFDKSPLLLMYECGAITLLKVCIYKHPEAINQLAQAVGRELNSLSELQFIKKDEQVREMITKHKDFLNFILDNNIDVDCEIVGPSDEFTSIRKLTQKFIDKITLAKFIFSHSQNNPRMQHKFNTEISTQTKPRTLEAINELGILLSNYSEWEIKDLMMAGLQIGLNASAEDSIFFDIDQDILLVMNKILCASSDHQTNTALLARVFI